MRIESDNDYDHDYDYESEKKKRRFYVNYSSALTFSITSNASAT
jgi:hypothetical protein